MMTSKVLVRDIVSVSWDTTPRPDIEDDELPCSAMLSILSLTVVEVRFLSVSKPIGVVTSGFFMDGENLPVPYDSWCHWTQ